MLKKILILNTLLILTACSSEPLADAPPWVKAPARVVENGYIIYVGSGEDVGPERSQFLAESMALQDLANECSFVPKGTRVEDRYSEKQKYTTRAFAKVAVEFQECDDAKKTTDPAQIKEMASSGFTEEIKKYQDIVEGASPELDGSNLQMPEEASHPTGSSGTAANGNAQFFVMRQYVAYQKEIVVLSPPAAFPPSAPQTVAFANNVTPVAQRVQMYETAHPELKTSPEVWSKVENKPQFFKNQRNTNNDHALHPPPQPRERNNNEKTPTRGHRRRRGGGNQEPNPN